jgi:ribosomal protein S18 acetylase RimI-like enzyme
VTRLTVRAATDDDVAAVVTLVESAYRGDASRRGWTTEADLLDGQRTDTEAVRETVRGDGVVLLAVDPAGALVACCQLEPRGTHCHFGLFAVDPSLQGSGLGRHVLAAAEDEARRRWSADRMEMTVIAQRSELIAWYERRGYRRTGETRSFPYGDERFGLPRRDDLHFVVLAKTLGRPGQEPGRLTRRARRG